MCMAMLCTTLSFAQQRNCGSMDYLQAQLLEDTKRANKMQQIELQTKNWITNNAQQFNGAIVTIPVVVHVVYNTSAENISTAQVISQIDVLNEDFRRLNSDANNTWAQAADTEIEFCLATVDPNGNSTNGINRVSTNVSAFGTNDEVKFASSGGANAWPAADYMNFWVCDISGGILGYAQFPGGNPATDGIVCDYQYFGTTGTATAPFNLGRTATHEVGHWLNLRHIWGDGNCNADDFVADTPTSDAANYGCASGHVSCSSTDMVQNYMDYSDDACMNLFTAGQRDRMQALFGAGGSKASLLNSNGCGGGSTPTCSDGVQNGNETGVDCGGSCAPCQSGCSQNEVVVSITLDNYPEETSWALVNSSGSTVASGGTYGSQPDGSTVTETLCVADGCYDFVISDAYGDGICCSYGSGSYSVTSGGSTQASGGSFGSSETTNFCLGGGSGPTPTCNDGIQNQGETGVDCGGPCTACASCNDGIQNQGETGVDCGGPCSACPSCNDGIQNQGETDVDCGGPCAACPTCNDGVQNQGETGVDCGGPCSPCGGGGSTVITDGYFETGWDGWSDGGSDCYRYSGSRSFEGSRSIRIRDNSGTASAMTSGSFNVSGYSSIDIEFYFYAWSMENGEDFWVRFYDGSSWNTVAAYARGTNFNNNTFYTATVTITNGQYNFPSNAQFRFQCDASANADHVYIDQVTITGNGNGTRVNGETVQTITELHSLSETAREIEGVENEVIMYPNPTRDILNISADELINRIRIYSLAGKLVQEVVVNNTDARLKVEGLSSGMYMMQIETEEEVINQKFIKD